MRKIILLFFFLISLTALAQNISLITYDIEEENIIVKWKSPYTNLRFSIYRSSLLISNNISLSNNLNYISKLGTFSYFELSNKNNYLLYIDSSPNIGTNYYFVLENKDGIDIVEFYPEQNYSQSFIVYIPLPKVNIDLYRDINTAIIKWDKIPGIEGYMVYKLPEGYNENITKLKPIITLSSYQNIIFDVIPSDTNFMYVVIPFTKQITNYYVSKKHNGVFLSMSGKVLENYIPSSISMSYKDENREFYTKTNIVFNTNVIFITNFIPVTNLQESSKIKAIQEHKNNTKENAKNQTNDDQEIYYYEQEDRLKYIVSKYFSKGDYTKSRKLLKELISELEEDELKGRAMIYLARVEYILGNKNTAINILFKAKKLIPSEADFWLSRFLVNR
ncbi:MAG: tetratricopeptide repeat protein [Brevinematia bacterium]